MIMNAGEIAVLGMAAVNAVRDIRRKEILFRPTLIFAAAGVIYGILQKQEPLFIVTGLLPGMMVMLLSAASRGAVGFGDAVFLAAAGIWTGWRSAAAMFLCGLLIQSAVSAVYKLSGGSRKELPFIPAMFAGYLLCLLFLK